jgi:hypothetical protein
MKFILDEQFMTSITQTHEWSKYKDIPEEELTAQQLLEILEGCDRWSITETIDHPEFTRLREELSDKGYIRIERSWWNGDRVLRSFQLNEVKYRKGDRFLSAGAMGTSIQASRKYGYKYKPG